MPGACPALPMKLPDLIWKMSKAYSSLYVSTFSVSCISHLRGQHLCNEDYPVFMMLLAPSYEYIQHILQEGASSTGVSQSAGAPLVKANQTCSTCRAMLRHTTHMSAVFKPHDGGVTLRMARVWMGASNKGLIRPEVHGTHHTRQ